MPANLATIINYATRELRDQASHYTTAQLQNLAKDVIEDEFSQIRPAIKVIDVDGNGTRLYAISLLGSDWVEGFSQIQYIHFPIDEDDPNYLETDSFIVEEKPDGTFRLRFEEDSPSSSEDFRVAYTYPHTVTIATDTTSIITRDERAAGMLLGREVLESLANEFAQLANVNAGKVRIDFLATSKRCENRAKEVNEKLKRALSYPGFVAARGRPVHKTLFFKHN